MERKQDAIICPNVFRLPCVSSPPNAHDERRTSQLRSVKDFLLPVVREADDYDDAVHQTSRDPSLDRNHDVGDAGGVGIHARSPQREQVFVPLFSFAAHGLDCSKHRVRLKQGRGLQTNPLQ